VPPSLETRFPSQQVHFHSVARKSPSGAQSLLLLLLLLLAIAPPGPAFAQYCPPGAAIIACDTVLLVCRDSPVTCDNVQSKLRATRAFSTIDTFSGGGTPTRGQLAAYHAVLVFRGEYSPFVDGKLLGDRLATYHDHGGGVVVAALANHNYALGGTYGTVANGYALLDYAQGTLNDYFSDSLGEVLEPQSPLMFGVSALSAINAWRSTAPVVAGRGVVVARWRGGHQEPLVLRGTRGNRTLVELNLLPGSNRVVFNWWTGDMALLLRNGLKYSRCMPCGPGTYAGEGEGVGGMGALV
jgi:hypothetical protein